MNLNERTKLPFSLIHLIEEKMIDREPYEMTELSALTVIRYQKDSNIF